MDVAAARASSPSASSPSGPAPSADPEWRAAQVALAGPRYRRIAMALGAGLRLLRDPDDTRQVFVLGLCLNGKRLPELVGRMVLGEDGLQLVHSRPSIDSRHVDFDALRALPDGTLGREYARFVDDHGLDTELFGDPPGLPETAAFVARRIRQSHDLWHVLTGYPPDIAGEVALQAFTYGQLRAPSSLALVIAGCARWGVREPALLFEVVRAFRSGRRARDLVPVHWEALWGVPVSELRARLAIEARLT